MVIDWNITSQKIANWATKEQEYEMHSDPTPVSIAQVVKRTVKDQCDEESHLEEKEKNTSSTAFPSWEET